MLSTNLKQNVHKTHGDFGGLEVACWPLVPKFGGLEVACWLLVPKFGGLEVACWLLVPKFAGSNRLIFKGEKILSTPSFGGEVKLSVPCRRFVACKNYVEVEF